MFSGKYEFGNAWLAAFARHGHDNSNTAFAFTPAAIKGPFYASMYERWHTERRVTKDTAAAFIERHWVEIERTCYGSRADASPKGQQPASAVKAEDALPVPKTDPRTALVGFQDLLDKDQATALVGLGLEHQPALVNAAQYILSRATPEQRTRFQGTITRAHALEAELTELVESEPDLTRGFEGQSDEPVRLLARMLAHLINNQVGAFARLGAEKQLPWSIIPDRLEHLKELTSAERQRMARCCAYIGQMSMLSTGVNELLHAQP